MEVREEGLNQVIRQLLQIHQNLLLAEQAVIGVVRADGIDSREWTKEQWDIFEAGRSVQVQRFAVSRSITDLKNLMKVDEEPPSEESTVVEPPTLEGESTVGEPAVVPGVIEEPPIDPLGLFFEEDFSSGDFSNSQNGWKWGGSDRGRANAEVVTGGAVPPGRHAALRLTYPGVPIDKDCVAQMDFHMGRRMKEIWIEWEEYKLDGTEGLGARWRERAAMAYDSNGVLVKQNGGLKDIRIWGHNYQGCKVGLATSVPGRYDYDGGSALNFSWSRRSDGVHMGAQGRKFLEFPNALGPDYDPSLGKIKRGVWQTRRFRSRVADPGEANGVLQHWIDGELVIDVDDLPLGWPDPNVEYFERGYFGGWSNSGFDETTAKFITNIKAYDSNPGWDSTTEPIPSEEEPPAEPNIPIDISPSDLTPLIQQDGSTKDWGQGWRTPGSDPKWLKDDYVRVVEALDNPTGSKKAIRYSWLANEIMRDKRSIYLLPSFKDLLGGFICEILDLSFIFRLSPNFQVSTPEHPKRSGMKLFGYYGHVGKPSGYFLSNAGGEELPWRVTWTGQPPGMVGTAGRHMQSGPRGTPGIIQPFPAWNILTIRHIVQSANGAGDGYVRVKSWDDVIMESNNIAQPADPNTSRFLDGIEFGPMRGHDDVPLPETDWMDIGGFFVEGRKAS